MQRYYFEIRTDDAAIDDEKGKEFPDLIDAYTHAAKIAYDCAQYAPPEPSEGRWRVNVINENGARLLTVLFPTWCRELHRDVRLQGD